MKITTKLSTLELKLSEWKGPFCNEAAPSIKQITSFVEWQKFWQESFKQQAPPVDFSKYFAVAVFLGMHNTGGYSVEFLVPMSDDAKVHVRYRVRKPGPGSFVIQAFTQPYSIKLYRKTSLKVAIVEE